MRLSRKVVTVMSDKAQNVQDKCEFNLLDEPWILVLDEAYRVKEVSLIDALCNAHLYRDLAGEMPTQDVAVLRLLLAVLLSIFLRRDPDGEEVEVTEDNAVELWMTLWERGKFPDELIRGYLEQYRERFWLFHPERPFYQVQSAKIGTGYTAAKLNGEMSESSNKIRLFPVRTGDGKNRLTYPEAARWLLHLNAYDDTSSKPKGRGLPSPGAGWLGKLGLIFAQGSSLFETLMLNMTLLEDGGNSWAEPQPIWEEEQLREKERVEIAPPDNPPALLTLQSRRILLTRDGEFVVGYSLLGGDFFEKQDALFEQMTVWRPDGKRGNKNAKIDGWLPRRHDPARQIWRDLPLIITKDDSGHQPGVVSWVEQISTIGDASPLNKNGGRVDFKIVSVQYGDKDFFVTDVFSDVLSFSAGILAEKDRSAAKVLETEIQRCDDIAGIYGRFAGDVYMASGGDGAQRRDHEKIAREQFYYRIDAPFRQWLLHFDPSLGSVERDRMIKKWHEDSKNIARAMANETAASAGSAAFAGRTAAANDQQQKRHYSVPAALNSFTFSLSKQ